MNNADRKVQDYVIEGSRMSFLDPTWSVVRDSVPGCGYEPTVFGLLSEILDRPGASFGDVGALYGFFSCWAGRRRPKMRIAAFEPEEEYLAVLARNMALNSLDFEVAPYALVDNRRTLTFHTRTVEPDSGFSAFRRDYVAASRNFLVPRAEPARHVVAGYFAPRASPLEFVDKSWRWSRKSAVSVDSSHEVAGISLDEWVDESGWCPTVLKIDVHGAEGLVLRGASESLSNTIEHVLLELHTPDMLVDSTYEEILALLEDRGFTLYELRGFRRHHGTLVPLRGKVRSALLDITTWNPEELYYMRFVYAKRKRC